MNVLPAVGLMVGEGGCGATTGTSSVTPLCGTRIPAAIEPATTPMPSNNAPILLSCDAPATVPAIPPPATRPPLAAVAVVVAGRG